MAPGLLGTLRKGRKSLGSRQSWVHIPALPCFHRVTLDLLLNLSESQGMVCEGHGGAGKTGLLLSTC